jgi:hypothetical protein
MGNCFSDPSQSKVKGQRLGSAPSSSVSAATKPSTATATTNTHTITNTASPGRAVGDGFEDVNRGKDPREMARIAAEERAKSVSYGE